MNREEIATLKSRVEELECKMQDSESRCIDEIFKYVDALGENHSSIEPLKNHRNIEEREFKNILRDILVYILKLEDSSSMTEMQQWLSISDVKLEHGKLEMLKRLLKEAQDLLDRAINADVTNTPMSSDESDPEAPSTIFFNTPGMFQDVSRD